ncbi:conserved hypothetical protein [Talaromyces stipitatus ATCC 10500]|uniref:Uncharacterized protein n=1 Tax=Talaromyces stipitatus (strain ATCC 10500 / CBS 375.48 / QM 6759 / NRRL 1006) TaxID=441959 RepID=B8ML32_TALSN|nr:uncharacterized protein TSTA_048880 [Talaromyces stipitatus ATCC 10500]EED15448.1 conserved hypothetical protein [Talaromyces stipitatus ATCC 10500]
MSIHSSICRADYIVAGGSQGVSSTVVHAISVYDGNIIVLDIRDTRRVRNAHKEIWYKDHIYHNGVADEKSLTSSFDQAAGAATEKPFVEHTWTDMQRVQEICFPSQNAFTQDGGLKTHRRSSGHFFASQLAAKQFLKKGSPGSIVRVASIISYTVLPKYRMSTCSSSKGTVVILRELLLSNSRHSESA